MRSSSAAPAALLLVLGAAGAPALAEPIFLSRQYSRCTNCHYSASGGGLLTPYGRSLSREELSTFGAGRAAGSPGREHEFLFGALGDRMKPLNLGIDLRPSHLRFDDSGHVSSLDLLMNADLTAAVQHGGLTVYGELGRQPLPSGTRITSFEHWVGYRTRSGLGLRAGRFLPAYGVHLADHTAFNRSSLGLDNSSQVYALELSASGDRQLVQVSAGPGNAETVSDAGQRAFTASGRWQVDVAPRVVVAASGLYRGRSRVDERNGAFGLALGVSPASRVTLWTQADVRLRKGASGPAYTLLAEASFELRRGIWLKVSPQLLTAYGDASQGLFRVSAGLNLLPRTHWNVVLSYYRDEDIGRSDSLHTFLAQLHLYL